MRTLITKQRYIKAANYALKRELTSRPLSSGRKFWRELGESIRKNYMYYLQGETI